MPARHIVCLVLLSANSAFASPVTELAAGALANSEGIDADVFADVTFKRAPDGFTLRYSRPLGEGGTQRCDARYRKSGRLAKLSCSIDYFTHSMGPSNRHIQSSLDRQFSEEGKVTAVSGRFESRSLKDQKVIERRKIVSLDDEMTGDFSKPLLILDAELLAAPT